MIGDRTSAMPADPVSIGIALADSLSRERALTSWESDLVAALVAKSISPHPLRRWTITQDTRLSELLASGLTAAEIGARIGRSTHAVHTRTKRLKARNINAVIEERHD